MEKFKRFVSKGIAFFVFFLKTFQVFAGDGLDRYAVGEPSPIDMESLSKAINEGKFKTLEEFVEWLPLECRKFYTLVYKSRSLQSASYKYPRVITPCSQARPGFILSFTGDPKGHGRNSVEILETDPQTFQMRAAEVVFEQNTLGRPVARLTHNPEKCAECHGSPLRPIWDRYPNWPGAYDSRLRKLPLNSKEWQGYEKFKSIRSKDPIYGKLVPFVENINQKDNTVTLGVSSPDSYAGTETVSFNSNFANYHLSTLHNYSIASDVIHHPDFDKYKFALIASEFKCKDIESFLPETTTSSGLNLTDTLRKVETGIKIATDRVVRSIAEQNSIDRKEVSDGDFGPPFNIDELYVLQKMGFDLQRFSSSPNPREMTHPTSLRNILGTWIQISPNDGFSTSPEGELLNQGPDDDLAICAKLKKKSLKGLAQVHSSQKVPSTGQSAQVHSSVEEKCPPSGDSPTAGQEPKINILKEGIISAVSHNSSPLALKRCTICHNMPEAKQIGAPVLDFSSHNVSLARRSCGRILSKSSNRMPPLISLSDSDFESLSSFFKCKKK
jgi:hypothetical protein